MLLDQLQKLGQIRVHLAVADAANLLRGFDGGGL